MPAIEPIPRFAELKRAITVDELDDSALQQGMATYQRIQREKALAYAQQPVADDFGGRVDAMLNYPTRRGR